MGDKLQRDAVNNRRKSEREKSINFNEVEIGFLK